MSLTLRTTRIRASGARGIITQQQNATAVKTATTLPPRLFIISNRAMSPNDRAQRPPQETAGRLQESLTNYLNRPTAQRRGGSLQRPG